MDKKADIRLVILSVCLAGLIAFGLSACRPAAGTTETAGTITGSRESAAATVGGPVTETTVIISTTAGNRPTEGQTVTADYDSEIVRTPPQSSKVGIGEDALIVRTAKDFSDYLSRHSHDWQFTDDDKKSLKAKYNQEFFGSNILICGVFASNSGSTVLKVDELTQTDNIINILFDIEEPEIGTAVMMSWHYFISMDAGGTEAATVVTNLPAQKPPVEYE